MTVHTLLITPSEYRVSQETCPYLAYSEANFRFHQNQHKKEEEGKLKAKTAVVFQCPAVCPLAEWSPILDVLAPSQSRAGG